MRVIQITLNGSAQQILVPNQQAPIANVCVSLLVVQNDSTTAADVVTLGDNTVTATKGIVIPAASSATAPSAPLILAFSQPRGSLLSQWWVFGTSGQTVTILYETAQ